MRIVLAPDGTLDAAPQVRIERPGPLLVAIGERVAVARW